MLPIVEPGRCGVVVAVTHMERAEAQPRRFDGVRILDQPGDCLAALFPDGDPHAHMLHEETGEEPRGHDPSDEVEEIAAFPWASRVVTTMAPTSFA